MAARILMFPRCRDQRFTRRHAFRMTELRPHKAEEHLARQLEIQRLTALARGCDPADIEIQLRALETAIRVELWHYVMQTPGDGAA